MLLIFFLFQLLVVNHPEKRFDNEPHFTNPAMNKGLAVGFSSGGNPDSKPANNNGEIWENKASAQQDVKLRELIRFFDPEIQSPIDAEAQPQPEILQTLSSLEDPHYDKIKCLRLGGHDFTSQGVVLKFNFSEHSQIISHAELYIYRAKSSSEWNVIRLYQILSKGELQNADFQQLLGVIYVAAHEEGWQTFNIDQAIESWQSGQPNLGLLIEITDYLGNPVNPSSFALSSSQHSPLLVLYIRQTDFSFYESVSEILKTENETSDLGGFKNIMKTTEVFKNISQGLEGCSRIAFKVDFKEIGLKNVIYPKSLTLYDCSGHCSIEPNRFTSHARFMRLFNSATGQINNCCVSYKYSPTKLTFYDTFGNIIIKTYHDMIVENCICK